jgi:Protein of unknown function (DUF4100)
MQLGVSKSRVFHLGKYKYKVFPMEQKKEELQPKKPEPYTKDDPKGKGKEHPNKVYVELPKWSAKEHKPSGSKEKGPTIMKWDARVQEPVPSLLNKDVNMWDGMVEEWARCKHMEMWDEKAPSKTKGKGMKPTMGDVIIQDMKEQIKKRASPAYHFASELQENVDVEALYKTLMDKEVLVKLGKILGSSFELCKQIQIMSKTQWVPVTEKVTGNNNLEVLISLVEHEFEHLSQPCG